MSSTPSPIEADYTRSSRAGESARAGLFSAPITWRKGLVIAAFAAVLVGVLLPLDRATIEFTSRLQEGRDLALGGDLRRELLFIQQYGDFVCLAIVGFVIFLLDTTRRRRLLDAAAAALCTGLVYQVVKILVGRPRPKFLDPFHFCGPLGTYPITRDSQTTLRHSWEVWGGISSDLWSMPSSHTAAATALSVILARMYPRLTPLVIVLALVVGLCRVVFAAHYPSDVVVGWSMGYIAAAAAMDGRWGQRLLSRRA